MYLLLRFLCHNCYLHIKNILMRKDTLIILIRKSQCTSSCDSCWTLGVASLNFQSVSPSRWSVLKKQEPIDHVSIRCVYNMIPLASLVLSSIMSAGTRWSYCHQILHTTLIITLYTLHMTMTSDTIISLLHTLTLPERT